MLFYMIFFVFQCVLFFLYLKLVKGTSCYFYKLFFSFFSLLLTLPFFLIYADCQGLINLTSIVSISLFQGSPLLSRGTGVRPVLVLLLFQLCFLIGGHCARRFFVSRKREVRQVDIDKYFVFALMLGTVALSYMLARAYFVSDFPLIKFLTTNESIHLRNLAFDYGHKTIEVPYIFRPSITSLFYRILLPLSGMMFFILGKKNYRPQLTFFLSAVFFCFSLFFLLGTMKRTPILFFLTWCFVALLLTNPSQIKRKFFVYAGVIVVFLCLSTAAYGISLDLLLKNLFRRIFIVEGLKEFLCLEHYGTTFSYLSFDIPMRYLHKILGEDVLTFSQVWKIQLGGVRGWSSIGVMAEFFASFGFAVASIAYVCWGCFLMKLDMVNAGCRSNLFYAPFLSCLMTIIAFSSTKGTLPQLFTGGGGLLLILLICLVIMSKPSTAVFSSES
ncbi:hypothetical protein ACQ0P8_13505 [Halodesulfovibrio aestuarii]|uniref:Oligosaccharide repeat unit polymerase n=1 Tax=Halodesulfovibrio aestuarii TaxID=126333 RepID=A0A8G2CAC4_9BACT|nr:hypothetical protein [Halodesulfovibrio aestuarii]SHJ29226.1 hypothetical protein SAMN05660830_02098 [Halodesulfovibrio aestuarii]